MTSISSPSSPRNLQFSRLLQSMLLGAAVLGGCADKDPADTGKTTKTSDDGGSSTGGQSSTSATTGVVPVTTSGATTTGDGSGDATGAGTTAPCTFLNCDDMMNVMNECDNWAQDCPEGQKCMPVANNGTNAWNATICVEVKPDPKQPGDECAVEGSGVSGIDSCVKGAMCWDVDTDTGMGVCVEQCTCSLDNPVCTTPNTTCTISNNAALVICLPVCDPLDKGACADGDVCVASDNLFICVLDASGDAGGANDPCEYVNACDPGFLCTNSGVDCGGSGCCTPYCDLESPQCPNGSECMPYYSPGDAPKCFEDIGICFTP